MNPARAVGIVLQNGKLLMMHRYKNGEEFYALLGGTVEIGETPEAACIRELKEEANIDVVLGRKVYELHNQNRTEHYFWVESFTGEPVLGGIELERHSPENSYALAWIDLNDLPSIPIQPKAIKNVVLALLSNRQGSS